MKISRYLGFLIFNHYYRDGNYKEDDMPYFTASGVVMIYEAGIIQIGLFFIEKHIGIGVLGDIFASAQKIVYGYGLLMCAWLLPLNYYFFVKRGCFDRMYNEFKNASINTKRNRIIGYTLLIIYWPIMIGVVGHLKYWFP